MADDERRSETFIREVDEELRRDQLKALWKRFAPLIIGVCVLVVAVTAGYRGWIWWHERQAGTGGRPVPGGDRADSKRNARRGRGGASGDRHRRRGRLCRAGAPPARRREGRGGRKGGCAQGFRRARQRQFALHAAARHRARSGRRCLRWTRATLRARSRGRSRSPSPAILGATRRARCLARPPIKRAISKPRARLSLLSRRMPRRRPIFGSARD